QATQELFKLAAGKASAVRGTEGNVIVRPKEIHQADLAKDKDALERYGSQLDTMVANDMIAQLIAALRARYGVSIDQQMFASAFQFQQQQQ
ncbi:MAG: hypothetical protein JOY81_15690, partial [Alphaproteobacteria bacterium]|nr:hypothetical protein [Alphaproteobacteria bacterium]